MEKNCSFLMTSYTQQLSNGWIALKEISLERKALQKSCNSGSFAGFLFSAIIFYMERKSFIVVAVFEKKFFLAKFRVFWE